MDCEMCEGTSEIGFYALYTETRTVERLPMGAIPIVMVILM